MSVHMHCWLICEICQRLNEVPVFWVLECKGAQLYIKHEEHWMDSISPLRYQAKSTSPCALLFNLKYIRNVLLSWSTA